MSKFHLSVKDLLEDVHKFLTSSLRTENLSTNTVTQRDKLLSNLLLFQNEYPELQLEFNLNHDSNRFSTSSGMSYVDMNHCTTQSSDKDNLADKFDSLEHSIAESDEYVSEEAKRLPAIIASDLSTCEKSGYLEKKRESLKGWLNSYQKRWCAVCGGVLYYYEKISDRKQKGCIILTGYEARALSDESKDGKKHSYCFELVCPGKRTYQFLATSEKDMQQWISAIEKYSLLPIQSRPISHNLQQSSENRKSPIPSDEIYEIVDESQFENPNDDKEEQPTDNQLFDYSEWYVGLWDCTGSDESELSFYRGDLIHVLSKEHDPFAWWVGELQGKIGLVPKSYLMEAYEAVA